MRPPVSVCIITYNEERNIGRCLSSVQWAEEVVVVDSFSQDRTVAICEEYGAKVVQRPFENYVDQKNYALSLTSHDWVFSLDADEVVSEELAQSISHVLSAASLEEVAFECLRLNDYLGEWATYGSFYPDYQLRLFHKKYGKFAGVKLHERVVVQGKVGRLKGVLYHYTYRDLSHHLSSMNSFTSIAAEELWLKGKTRWPMGRAVLHGLGRFLQSYFLKRGIFHGARGLLLSVMHGYYGFLKYAKLWELCEKSRREEGKK